MGERLGFGRDSGVALFLLFYVTTPPKKYIRDRRNRQRHGPFPAPKRNNEGEIRKIRRKMRRSRYPYGHWEKNIYGAAASRTGALSRPLYGYRGGTLPRIQHTRYKGEGEDTDRRYFGAKKWNDLQRAAFGGPLAFFTAAFLFCFVLALDVVAGRWFCFTGCSVIETRKKNKQNR